MHVIISEAIQICIRIKLIIFHPTAHTHQPLQVTFYYTLLPLTDIRSFVFTHSYAHMRFGVCGFKQEETIPYILICIMDIL